MVRPAWFKMCCFWVILDLDKAAPAKGFRASSVTLIEPRLLAYYDQIKRPELAVDFHLVLMSPQRPQKLTKPLPKRLNQLWPGPELPWLQLKLETSVYEVTRCQPNGKSAADGD